MAKKSNNKSSGKKTTSPKVASTASKVLRDGRTSTASKSVAGSALSQREKNGEGTRSGGPDSRKK